MLHGSSLISSIRQWVCWLFIIGETNVIKYCFSRAWGRQYSCRPFFASVQNQCRPRTKPEWLMTLWCKEYDVSIVNSHLFWTHWNKFVSWNKSTNQCIGSTEITRGMSRRELIGLLRFLSSCSRCHSLVLTSLSECLRNDVTGMAGSTIFSKIYALATWLIDTQVKRFTLHIC